MGEETFVGVRRGASARLQGVAPGLGQAHGVGAGVGGRSFALQQPFGDHPRDEIGEGGSIDARGAHEVVLGHSIDGGGGRENGELSLGQRPRAGRLGMIVQRQLKGPMQQVCHRAVQPVSGDLAFTLGHGDPLHADGLSSNTI
jgi:hypothetical protein